MDESQYVLSFNIEAKNEAKEPLSDVEKSVETLKERVVSANAEIQESSKATAEEIKKTAEQAKTSSAAVATSAQAAGDPFADLKARLADVRTGLDSTAQAAQQSAQAQSDAFKGPGGPIGPLDELRSMLEGIPQRYLLIGGAIATVFSTLAMIGRQVAVTGAEAYEASQRLEGMLEATGHQARVTSKEIAELATNIQKSMGISDEAIKEAASTLAGFTNIRGANFTRTLEVAANIATAKGMEIQNATRMIARSLETPGEYLSMLKRVGIVVSETTQTMAKELQSQGRTAEAQGVILDELGKKYAGLGEKMGETMQGAQRRIMLALGDIMEGTEESQKSVASGWDKMADAIADPQFVEAMQRATGLFAEMYAAATNTVAAAVGGVTRLVSGVIAQIDRLDAKLSESEWYSDFKDSNGFLESMLSIAEGATGGLGVKFTPKTDPIGKGPTNPRGGSPSDAYKQQVEQQEEYITKLKRAAADERTRIEMEYQQSIKEIQKKFTQEGPEWEKRRTAAIDAAKDVRLKAIAAIEAREAKSAQASAARTQREQERDYQDSRRRIEAMIKDREKLRDNRQELMASLLDEEERATYELGQTIQQISELWKGEEAEIAAIRGRLTQAALDKAERERAEAAREAAEKQLQEQTEFSRRAAEVLQDSFANVFMSVGKGWKSLLSSMLSAFQQLFAQQFAKEIAELLQLPGTTSGGAAGSGVLSGILNKVFGGPAKSATPAGSPASKEGLVAGGMCKCPEVQQIGNVVTRSISGITQMVRNFGQGFIALMKPLFGGLWKFITGTLSSIWKFIQSAIAAIRSMAASSGGGGGGGFWGTVIGAVGSMVGLASGGPMRSGQLAMVGERGPEVVAGPGTVIPNSALGGMRFEFKPAYSIVFEGGGGGDQRQIAALQRYIEKRDIENRNEIMEMLRRNGYGRMRR